MDFTEDKSSALDLDIITTAYVRADPRIKFVVSSILTSLADESSFMYSYISNKKADEIGLTTAMSKTYGFTYMSGEIQNTAWLIMNAFKILDELSNGEELVKIILSCMLNSLTKENYIDVLKRTKHYE